jgi:hypothetical protein
MARGFFARRRGNGADETAADWPELPGAAEQAPAQALDAEILDAEVIDAEVLDAEVLDVEDPDAQDLDVPALAYVQAIASAVPAPASDPPEPAAQSALVRHIAACRSAVADTLYESSRDYRVLCDLVHEGLPACEAAITELRRRLAGNVYYAVLAKLDEAHAVAEAGTGAGTGTAGEDG